MIENSGEYLNGERKKPQIKWECSVSENVAY